MSIISIKHLSSSIIAAILASAAIAKTPKEMPSVATDIAPVHSLVARVMEGIGAPHLVIPAGASPHEYNLKPSEAAALQNADIVFWIGEDLSPWLESAIDVLAKDAEIIELLEADGTVLLDFREGALFEAHDHGEDEGHEEEGHDEHDHGGHDPHAWLSPDNAAHWLELIAAKLSAADPKNADAYLANAAQAQEELIALEAEISAVLDPAKGNQFVVFHDAYQYFEVSFDFPAAGAISLSDASDPSPARIKEIQTRVRDEGIDCVLSEPQYNPNMVATVMEGTTARTATIDLLGSNLTPGSALYPQLLRNLGNTLADCLK